MIRTAAVAAAALAILGCSARGRAVSASRSFELIRVGKADEGLALLRREAREHSRDLFAQRAYQQALKNLNRWDELDAEYGVHGSRAKDPAAYSLYASAIGERNRYAARLAVARGTDIDRAHPWLAFDWSLQNAMEQIDKEDFDGALKSVPDPILSPFAADAYMVRAAAFSGKGEFDRAIAEVEKAVEFFPWDPDQRIELGDFNFVAGRIDEAFREYRAAEELRESASTHGALASCFGVMGDSISWRAEAEAAVRSSSATLSDKALLSGTLAALGRWPESLEAAIDFERNTDEVGAKVAVLGARRGAHRDEPGDALAMSRLLDAHPKNMTALSEAADRYSEHLQFEQALALLDRAVAIAPRHVTMLTQRALVEAALGKDAATERDVESAVSILPKSPVLRRLEGDLRMNAGRSADALNDYNESLRRAPEDGPALLGRCSALVALRSQDEALAACKEAIIHAWDDDSKARAKALLCQAQINCR